MTGRLDIEPARPGDQMIVVRIRAKDWHQLTGIGLPANGLLQFVRQPEPNASGWPTYGVRVIEHRTIDDE
jgi:hypothetical protein